MATIAHKEDVVDASHKLSIDTPYNFFFVVFYAALGAAAAIHPVNQQTLEIAPGFAALTGRFLASLFFVMAYLSWRNEFKGKWLTISTLPAVVWGAYTMASLLGQDRTSWVIVVYIAAAVALLVYIVELRLNLQASELLTERFAHEEANLKKELTALKTEIAALKAEQTDERK